jgi:hypothetical protein
MPVIRARFAIEIIYPTLLKIEKRDIYCLKFPDTLLKAFRFGKAVQHESVSSFVTEH